jgi:NADH-ubiquinone oxidoreductase chain 4L
MKLATNVSYYFAIAIYLVALLCATNSPNLIILVISLELLLLSVSLLLVNLSFTLDDLVGSNLTLVILPMSGAETAVALAFLVAYYPLMGSLELI